MNLKKILGIIILAALIIVAVVVSTRNGTPTNIKIGVIDVLSGDKAPMGEDFKRGVELAQEEYAATHSGQKVEVVFADDGYDEGKASVAFKKLVNEDKVDGLIVATSPGINGIYAEATTTDLPIITYGTQTQMPANDNIFQIFPDFSFADQALAVAMKALNASTTQGVVAVYTNDTAIIRLYNAFQDSLDANIDEYALDLSMNQNPDALSVIAEKVLAKKPKYIFITGYANLNGQFVKILQSLPGGKTPTLVFDYTLNQSLDVFKKELTDLNKLNGSIVISPEKTDVDGFVESFTKKYGAAPGELAAYGYDSFMSLVNTAAANKSGWIKNIQSLKNKGVTGSIVFDDTGRRAPQFSVTNFADGKIPETK